MRSRKKGLLVVISAPSGCGKTTIVNALLERNPRLVRSISATTRQPRNGEADGRDYFFMDRKSFLAQKQKGAFLEHARVFGNYYGTFRKTVRDTIARGKDTVLAIDVQGARQVRRKEKGVFIFVMPPSMEVLEKRLRNRKSDSTEEISKRLEQARTEMACAREYDYIITNRDVRDSVRLIECLMEKERREADWKKSRKTKTFKQAIKN